MPIIVYNNKLKNHIKKDRTENISFAFDCAYNEKNYLTLKNFEPNYFDFDSWKFKIEEAIAKFDEKLQKEYEEKNEGVYYLGVLDYFSTEIPSLYSLKFIDEIGETIYYTNELKKKEDE